MQRGSNTRFSEVRNEKNANQVISGNYSRAEAERLANGLASR